MKFFIAIILISNYWTAHSVYPYGVRDILEPSRLLYCQCSIPHNLLPKNVGPSTSFLTLDIPFANGERYDLSTSSPNHSYSKMVDIQCACAHDLYLLLPLISGHSLNRIFGLSGPCISAGYLLLTLHIDTLLPKRYGHSSDLLYVNYACSQPYRKSIKFVETKVTAINCRVLTV